MELLEKARHYVTHYPLSDIHLRVGAPVAIRVDGDIIAFADDRISATAFEQFVAGVLSDAQRLQLAEVGDADLAVAAGAYRFRINLYKTADGLSAVLRKIEQQIPDLDSLGLPPIAHSIIELQSGLVLVTGPTGSGKSTTLAALIDRINQQRKAHIITIEDPIEFVHTSQNSIVSQREVARDTASFASALRAALREDPDVILVGELRDLETIQLALTASETGHLVLGTLHTSGAPNTINRIIDVFPPQQQDQIRAQLSQSLRLVITQQLLRRAGGNGRVAAFEVMVGTPAVRNLIRENKVFQIPSIMQVARSEGMVTLEAAIEQLRQSGAISQS